MARSEAEIHSIELLVTLDYLLHHTDEDHPARQQDICRYANDKYGIKYNNGAAGDKIKRQRIANCLNFLERISNEFTSDVPFVLEKTDGGKYYIEQRNGLNASQVASLLAAIKNDQYTKDEDVDTLCERVLDAFSTNEDNRNIIKKECNKLIRTGSKYDAETLRKMRLIETAYRDAKMIKVRYKILDSKLNVYLEYFFWYRVYFIKEYNHELYALLIPIAQITNEERLGLLKFNQDYVFQRIDDIDIPTGSARVLLCEDDNRDLNEQFKLKNPEIAKEYGSLDNFLVKTKLPFSGESIIVSFYFDLHLLKFIKKSYEEYFSEDFNYQQSNISKNELNDLVSVCSEIRSFTLLDVSDTTNKKPTQGLATISINKSAFISWLLSHPHKQGNVIIADMITIIKPSGIKRDIALYYRDKLLRYSKYLDD